MSSTRRTFATLATLGVLSVVPLSMAPLSANAAPKADQATGGSAVITNDDATPFATENVGGGTWSYGTSYGSGKTCYSYYIHPSHQHTATAILGSDVQKASAKPGVYAKADAHGGWLDTCHTYWNVI